jgi:ribonuclease HI
VPFQFAPWDTGWKVEFRPYLREKVVKAETSKCKEVALETLAQLPKPDIEFWTDGSATGGTRDGGAGVIQVDAVQATWLQKPTGVVSSSYKAEMVAILTALRAMRAWLSSQHEDRPKIAWICTDSKSSIEKLQSGPWKQDQETAVRIWQELIELTGEDKASVIFQWVPGHCDLDLNEAVDRVAKKATTMDQSVVPLDISAAKMVLKNQFKEAWELDKQTEQYRPSFPIAKYVPSEKEAGMRRKERVILAQFRTGGKSLLLASYRHFLTRDTEAPENPSCRFCNMADETVEHIFNQCNMLYQERSELLNLDNPMKSLYDKPKRAMEFLYRVGVADRI